MTSVNPFYLPDSDGQISYQIIKTSNIKPTKCNLVYQAIPKKLVKVDKPQTTFKGAEGTKIYSVRRKAIPDIYNSLSEKMKTLRGCCYVV